MKYRYLTIDSVCLSSEPHDSAISEVGVCVHTGTLPSNPPSFFGFQKIRPVYQLDTLAFLPGLIIIFMSMDNVIKLCLS